MSIFYGFLLLIDFIILKYVCRNLDCIGYFPCFTDKNRAYNVRAGVKLYIFDSLLFFSLPLFSQLLDMRSRYDLVWPYKKSGPALNTLISLNLHHREINSHLYTLYFGTDFKKLKP